MIAEGINGADLDRWITGNYDEGDPFSDDLPSTCGRCWQDLEDGSWQTCETCGHTNAHECPDGTVYCPECEITTAYAAYLAEDEELMPPAWCPQCGADLTASESVRISETFVSSRLSHAEPYGYYQDRASTLGGTAKTVECVECGHSLPVLG